MSTASVTHGRSPVVIVGIYFGRCAARPLHTFGGRSVGSGAMIGVVVASRPGCTLETRPHGTVLIVPTDAGPVALSATDAAEQATVGALGLAWHGPRPAAWSGLEAAP